MAKQRIGFTQEPEKKHDAQPITRLAKPSKWMGSSRSQLRNLTPPKLASIFDNVYTSLYQQMELADLIIDSDDHIASSCAIRRDAVLDMAVEVKEPKQSSGETKQAADILRSFVDGEIFRPMCEHLLRAYLPGYSAVEMTYTEFDGVFIPSAFYPVRSRHFTLSDSLAVEFYEDPTGYGETIVPNNVNFIIHHYATNQSQPGVFAVIRQLGLLYFMNRLNFGSWAEFLDAGWNLPLIHIQAAEGTNLQELQNIIADFQEFSRDKTIVTPVGAGVNVIETKGIAPFSDWANFYERRISKKILGNDTTQNGLAQGSVAGANEASAVRSDLRGADAVRLDATLNCWVKAWVNQNWGPQAIAPMLRHYIPTQSNVSYENLAALDKAFNFGVPLLMNEVYAKLGFTRPDGISDLSTDIVKPNVPTAAKHKQDFQKRIDKEIAYKKKNNKK